MSLNVKGTVEINTQGASASIRALNNNLEHFNKISYKAKGGLDNLAHGFQAAQGAWNVFSGAISKFNNLSNSFIQTADAINTMNARLKLTTTSGAHFELLKKQIDSIAKST